MNAFPQTHPASAVVASQPDVKPNIMHMLDVQTLQTLFRWMHASFCKQHLLCLSVDTCIRSAHRPYDSNRQQIDSYAAGRKIHRYDPALAELQSLSVQS